MAILTANNQSLTEITALPSVITTGSMVLLETETASSSSTLDFTSGIDSTYDEYVFKFYNIHPETDAQNLTFQANVSGGSGYNETITSTFFYAYYDEADSGTTLGYATSMDQAQGTAFQRLLYEMSSDADHAAGGYLHLFNPSSTTFVKHFISRFNNTDKDNYNIDNYCAGYFNTTSAIDEIQFKMSSGDIDAGTIKMYGVV